MPEGPEIKFYYELMKNLKGKKINSIEIISGRYINHPLGNIYTNLNKQLPLKIIDIGVKGKAIWWKLSNNTGIVFTHGMTGGWIFNSNNNSSMYSREWFNKKYNRIKFVIGKKHLYFNDMRSFGTFQIYENEELFIKKLDSIGPSVLEKPSKDIVYKELFRNPEKEIGIALMEQDKISGIGNYLRADILWKSKISPHRLIKNLSIEDKAELYKNIIKIPMKHFKYMMKYDKLYPDSRIKLFLVYSKDKDPYGNKVIRETLGNRTIHWVPSIQK